MRDSMLGSATTLLRLSPSRSKTRRNWLHHVFAKGKQLRTREEVSAELRRVDGDMQALLRRFSVSFVGGGRRRSLLTRPSGRPLSDWKWQKAATF
jgi:hypothetical protein